MNYNFTKMHGLGNDFVVFDAINQTINMNEERAQFIADRHFGIGCDQILLVEPPRTDDTTFYYRIFNADGSEVEQCGNGARCFARFVRDQALNTDNVLHVGTQQGVITLYHEANDNVRVNMGQPQLRPSLIPFKADQQAISYELLVADQILTIGAVSMGNPHSILIVDDIETTDIESLGPLIEQHIDFPQRTNAGFMQIIDRTSIKLRVYERGAGETLACGTGACAAVVSGILRGQLDNHVNVELAGGTLHIQWDGDDQPVWMTGAATRVFSGTIDL